MPSTLSIVNAALNEFGEEAVSNVNDTGHALILSQKIPLIYRQTLSDTNWTFAKKYTGLTKLAQTGTKKLPYVWQLPPDFNRLVQVYDNINWEIFGDAFYTDAMTEFNISYISNLTSTNLWPSAYEIYFIYRLCASASLVMTNNVQLTEYLKAEWLRLKLEAVSDNVYREGLKDRTNNKYDRRLLVM